MSNGTIVMVFHTSKEPPFVYFLILLLIYSVFDHTPPLCLPQLLSDTRPPPATPPLPVLLLLPVWETLSYSTSPGPLTLTTPFHSLFCNGPKPEV